MIRFAYTIGVGLERTTFSGSIIPEGGGWKILANPATFPCSVSEKSFATAEEAVDAARRVRSCEVNVDDLGALEEAIRERPYVVAALHHDGALREHYSAQVLDWAYLACNGFGDDATPPVWDWSHVRDSSAAGIVRAASILRGDDETLGWSTREAKGGGFVRVDKIEVMERMASMVVRSVKRRVSEAFNQQDLQAMEEILRGSADAVADARRIRQTVAGYAALRERLKA